MNAPVALSGIDRDAAMARANARYHLGQALHLFKRLRNPWLDQRLAELDEEEMEFQRMKARREYQRYRRLRDYALEYRRTA